MEAGQNNLPNVHVRNQDIAGHFPRVRRFHIIKKKRGSPQNLPDVLKEAEIEVFILKPSELQVSINIGAVSVPVPATMISNKLQQKLEYVYEGARQNLSV